MYQGGFLITFLHTTSFLKGIYSKWKDEEERICPPFIFYRNGNQWATTMLVHKWTNIVVAHLAHRVLPHHLFGQVHFLSYWRYIWLVLLRPFCRYSLVEATIYGICRICMYAPVIGYVQNGLFYSVLILFITRLAFKIAKIVPYL